MDISEKIRTLRRDKGLTQAELAQIAGVSAKAVSAWELGTRDPKIGPIKKICIHFGMDLNAFIDVSSDFTKQKAPLPEGAEWIDFSKYHKIPILGRIAAGLPIYAEENIEGYTLTDLNHGGEYFALRVRGDSMNAAQIMDGGLVIVRRQEEVESGEIAVVLVNSENATIKRFYRTGTTVTLMPQSTNPKHKPQIYDLAQTQIKILGKVIKAETLIQ